MEALEILNYPGTELELGHIVHDGEPWFIASDVCEILEIKNSRDAVAKIEKEDRLTSVVTTSGQGREMTFVNESGVYELVFLSRKPEAKAFRKWITKEVLPQIRKTGMYVGRQSELDLINAAKKELREIYNRLGQNEDYLRMYDLRFFIGNWEKRQKLRFTKSINSLFNKNEE
jgi:anti-repressor protein